MSLMRLELPILFIVKIAQNKFLAFCFYASAPRSDVVLISQKTSILSLISFCIYKLSFTKLSCEERSVWFSIFSGLIGFVIPTPRM